MIKQKFRIVAKKMATRQVVGRFVHIAFAVIRLLEFRAAYLDLNHRQLTIDSDYKVEEIVKSLVEATMMVVKVVHSRDLILSVCNKVIFLEHGSQNFKDRSKIFAVISLLINIGRFRITPFVTIQFKSDFSLVRSL